MKVTSSSRCLLYTYKTHPYIDTKEHWGFSESKYIPCTIRQSASKVCVPLHTDGDRGGDIYLLQLSFWALEHMDVIIGSDLIYDNIAKRSVLQIETLLVGNGIIIQFGGSLYSNKSIIKRTMENANYGQYRPDMRKTLSQSVWFFCLTACRTTQDHTWRIWSICLSSKWAASIIWFQKQIFQH